jgi:hypothetical protein
MKSKNMKNMKNIIFRLIYVLAFLLPLCMASCEEEQATEEVTLSRMFRPVTLTTEISNGIEVKLSWTKIADANYSFELSQDSLLFTTNLQSFTVNDNNSIDLVLLSATRYSARVKSISISGVSADSGWQEITFKTGL